MHASDRVRAQVIGVMFMDDATLAQRRSAVEQVDGGFVGGVRHSGEEGEYLVRVPQARTPAELEGDRDVLASFPFVVYAAPIKR